MRPVPRSPFYLDGVGAPRFILGRGAAFPPDFSLYPEGVRPRQIPPAVRHPAGFVPAKSCPSRSFILVRVCFILDGLPGKTSRFIRRLLHEDGFKYVLAPEACLIY